MLLLWENRSAKAPDLSVCLFFVHALILDSLVLFPSISLTILLTELLNTRYLFNFSRRFAVCESQENHLGSR